jgi:hypothetical protein
VNTLNREQTAHLLGNPTIYGALRRHWSALVTSDRKHSLTAAHHLIYLALIGKDWRKSFTPVVNARKLLNGGHYNWGLFDAVHALQFAPANDLLAPFDGLLTIAHLFALRTFIPTFTNLYSYEPSSFANSAWPFDAYPAVLQLPAKTQQEPANA